MRLLRVLPAAVFLSGVIAVTASAPAQRAAGAPQRPQPQYIGPGSCSATACHGGVQPQTATAVFQNEYTTWVVKDKHARAYEVLKNPVSQRMGKILAIGKPEESPRCLACHALAPPASQIGRKFDISEGVSCESCHGPASAWLGPHTLRNWKSADSIALGMFDTSDLVSRTSKCLSCHLGTSEKQVDHAMIAAGHPDLTFELDSFSAIMPPHWKRPTSSAAGAKAWAVGQAVQLREALLRLARRAQDPGWPEYAEMDCFSCHHPLTRAEDSWRQARGYPDRRPGAPPWNAAHYAVFRVLLREADAQLAADLESAMRSVLQMAPGPNTNRAALADAARRGAGVADRAAQQLNRGDFDRARVIRLIQAIAAEADAIAFHGTRSAEQAAMAVNALFIAGSAGQPLNSTERAAVDELFRQLQNPSTYNAPRFAAQLRKVGSAVKSR